MDKLEYHRLAIAHYHSIRERAGFQIIPTVAMEGAKEVFFRGRIADPLNLTPPQNHFSYPPPQYCTGYGRANIPYHPVFYAGRSPQVIANELRIELNSWLHIGVFYSSRPTRITRLLLLHDGFTKQELWAKHRDTAQERILAEWKSADDPEVIWQRLQATALAFRGPNYQDTSAISHFWLYEVGLDGIVYPSLQNNDFCNYALSPSFVDTNLRLCCVHACFWRLDRLELHFIGFPTDDQQSLRWRETDATDVKDWLGGYPTLMS